MFYLPYKIEEDIYRNMRGGFVKDITTMRDCKSKAYSDDVLEVVKKLRPIDDACFEVIADDIAFCQEMLRIILSDGKLIVKDVVVQKSIKNIYGRSVRLDALCTLGNGKKCNIEVQRTDNDDHLRRVRFNAASIAVKDSEVKQKFYEIEDIIVVYISEFDIFGDGFVLYHINNVVQETNKKVDDGLTRIFVNTEVKDGSIISEYMTQFKQTEISGQHFPELKRRMEYAKNSRGGLRTMCNALDELIAKREEKARKEGELQGCIKNVKAMYAAGIDTFKIASIVNIPLEEVEKILAE